MNRRSLLIFLMLVSLGATAVSAAGYGSPRQYYSGWQKHPQHRYSFRKYYYKPTPTYAGYKHHYVIHHPSRPKHLYFYNPYKKTYWGRCELDHQGKAEYSMLEPKDRKGTLDEIPESAFPKPAPLPPIPESEDGLSLDLPPDDLPADVDTAPVG